MLGLTFTVEPAHVLEEVLPDETPEATVQRLAREKALAVTRVRPEAAVLGGDTVVVLDNEILGKPTGPQDAEDMLLRLAGCSHIVASGLAVALPSGEVHSGVATTEVSLALSELRSPVPTSRPESLSTRPERMVFKDWERRW